MAADQDWTTACQALFPDLNPHPVIETDESGRVTYCNPAARQQFPDLEPAALQHPLLKNARAAVELHQRDGTISLVREVQVGERTYEQHVACIKARGRTHSYVFDITDRKHAEAVLLNEKQQLERMLKSMLDREGRLVELKQEVNALLRELGHQEKYGV